MYFRIAISAGIIASILSNAYGQKSTATRQETLEWIKGKVVDLKNYPTGGLAAKNSVLSDFSFEYNACVIQYSFKSDTKGNQVVRFQKVDLSNMASCEISSDSTSVVLKSLYDQKVVKNWWTGDSFPAHVSEENAMLFDTFTVFTTPKFAKRIKKAFDHVTSLCGGGKKEEKF
jgi:hypothetical protein